MRKAFILAQRSQLARPHRLQWAAAAPSASMMQSPGVGGSGSRIASSSTQRTRSYATHRDGDAAAATDAARASDEAKDHPAGDRKRKGDDQESSSSNGNDSNNSKDQPSSSPFPGLEGFFGGKLSRGGNPGGLSGNSGQARRSAKDGFPFSFPGASESGKDKEAEQLNKSKKSEGGSGGPGGSSGGPSAPQGLGPYLVPLGALVLFHFLSNGESSSREITWQEFRTAFLDKGLVDKLVVVNRSKVRVHLHSNATGVLYPQSPAADGRSSYYFSIGSVEAFEKKLDDAQSELGIPSSERVPVAYKDETSISSTLVSFAPTLMIVGLLYYLSRRAGGGAGGGIGGGPGGIFGVGKSKAKMFNVGDPVPFLHKPLLTLCVIARDRYQGQI